MGKEEKRKPVRVLRNNEGTAIGVVVETLDEKFGIALEPLDGGKSYKWKKAMERLKELGVTTFNEKQGRIITAYRSEINECLWIIDKNLGFEWTCSSCYFDSKYAYEYVDSDISLNVNRKTNLACVRPLIPQYIIDKFDK